MVACFLAVIPLVGLGQYGFIFGQACLFDWKKTTLTFTIFMVSICFCGPLFTMIFCYVKIFNIVRQSRSRLKGSGAAQKSAIPSVSAYTAWAAPDASAGCQSRKIERSSDVRIELTDGSHRSKNVSPHPPHQLSDPGPHTSTQTIVVKCGKCAESQDTNNSRSSKEEKVARSCKNINTRSGFESKTKSTLKEGDSEVIKKVNSNTTQDQMHSRLATTFLVVILVFLICWLPMIIIIVWSVLSEESIPNAFFSTAFILAFTNSGCNPIIYGIMNRRFRNGYKRLYCRKCLKSQ